VVVRETAHRRHLAGAQAACIQSAARLVGAVDGEYPGAVAGGGGGVAERARIGMALDHQRNWAARRFRASTDNRPAPAAIRRRAAAHEKHALLGFQQIDSQAFVAGSVIGKDCGSSGRWCGVVT